MGGKAPVIVVAATLLALGLVNALLPTDADTLRTIAAPAVQDAAATEAMPPPGAGSITVGLLGAGLIGLWLFNLRRRHARPRPSGQWGRGFGSR